MTAAARLTDAGFRLQLNDTGGLVVAPSRRLDDEWRTFIRAHLVQIKDELRRPANTPARRAASWRIRFKDGTGCIAVNTTGAEEIEMLAIACDQFGAARVIAVEGGP